MISCSCRPQSIHLVHLRGSLSKQAAIDAIRGEHLASGRSEG